MVSITVRTKQQTTEAEKRRGFWFLAMAASASLGMFGVAGAISPLVMREHDYLRGLRVRLRGLGGLLRRALEVCDLVEELDDGCQPRQRIRRGPLRGDRVVAVARLRARARGRAVLARGERTRVAPGRDERCSQLTPARGACCHSISPRLAQSAIVVADGGCMLSSAHFGSALNCVARSPKAFVLPPFGVFIDSATWLTSIDWNTCATASLLAHVHWLGGIENPDVILGVLERTPRCFRIGRFFPRGF